MPVQKVKNGYQWGSSGKVYSSKAKAEAQGKAAYANGYKGDDMPKPPPSEGTGMPIPENAGPQMPAFKRPAPKVRNMPETPKLDIGEAVPNNWALKPVKQDKDGAATKNVSGKNARAYQTPALPSDPMQPMPVPADPPKGTQNRGGQPQSFPDTVAGPWGSKSGSTNKTHWPELGGSGPVGSGLAIK